MQVVILCGGLGTRLREETVFIPKPMVGIGTRPVLWHIMKIYSQYGFNNFVLALGYKGDAIKQYFYTYDLMNSDATVEIGNREGIQFHQRIDEVNWRVTLVETGQQTLKGGRLKRVEKYVNGDVFMMTYGDGVADVNISKLLDFHHAHGRIATVTGVHPTGRFGELKIDGDRVASLLEKPDSTTDYINGGFFVFRREIFDYLIADDRCDLEIGPLERLSADGQMMVYKHGGFWACMDTQRDVEFLNSAWIRNEAPWKVW